MTKKALDDEPWACNDCGIEQQLVTHNGQSFYSNSGWYWVQLRPGEKPVYLDAACFDAYNDEWPEYDGTYENSPWQGGTWEGKWLWTLPADYFARRDAYRLLPRWRQTHNGFKLVAHDGRILGLVEGYGADLRKRGLYKALDADRKPLTDTPMWAGYARGAVEVHLGLTGPGMVQR